MTADLRAIQTWKTWRYTATEDASAYALKAGSAGQAYSAGAANIIGVAPYSAIAIRMFGTNAENDTASMSIHGLMSRDTKYGSGPGQGLWSGQVVLGSWGATSSGIPINDGKWPTAGTHYEVDTYDSSGGYNTCQAVVLSGNNQAMLILPTLGYSHLYMTLSNMDGTGTEMSTLGAIYREIAMGGVV